MCEPEQKNVLCSPGEIIDMRVRESEVTGWESEQFPVDQTLIFPSLSAWLLLLRGRRSSWRECRGRLHTCRFQEQRRGGAWFPPMAPCMQFCFSYPAGIEQLLATYCLTRTSFSI